MLKKNLRVGQIIKTRDYQFLTLLNQHPRAGEHDQYPKGKCFVGSTDVFIHFYNISEDMLCNDENMNARNCDIIEVYSVDYYTGKLNIMYKRPEIEYYEMTKEEIESKIQQILKGRKLIIKN